MALPPQSAAAEVFSTAELLEQILQDLSIDRLLILKRVTRFWNALITTSPPLQRKLYQRADTTRQTREYNPLFEDFFSDIGCAQDVIQPPPPLSNPTTPSRSSKSESKSQGPPAHLKISPLQMRKLLKACPRTLRSMSMFQPPCRYYVTLPSATPWNFSVKIINEPDVPVVRAVEKVAMIVEMEAEKRRNLRRNLEEQLRAEQRGPGMRLRQQRGGNAGAVNA